MKFRPTYADANTRVSEVLEAIIASQEWRHYSQTLSSLDFTDAIEAFPRFLDICEGLQGEDWLGIMEWAVLEEMRSSGSNLSADPIAIDNIVARMAGHSNIELVR